MNTSQQTIEIDGRLGEGGGQVLRTSLVLAMLTGRRLHITNIRAGRQTAGLLRQHLACVQALHQICGGTVEGDHVGSTELVAEFGKPVAGDYEFRVGSAGSTALVFQTAVYALLSADGPSTITIEGGTHAMAAPAADSIRDGFLPVLEHFGAKVEFELQRVGFFPVGAGRIKAVVQPIGEWKTPESLDGGPVVARTATIYHAHTSEKLIADIAHQLRRHPDWNELRVETVDCPESLSPGVAMVLRVQKQAHTSVFFAPMKRGQNAPKFAGRLSGKAHGHARSGASFCEHMTDQVLIPLALAGGGAIVSERITHHTRTNAEVISMFLPVHFEYRPVGGGNVEVKCVSGVGENEM